MAEDLKKPIDASAGSASTLSKAERVDASAGSASTLSKAERVEEPSLERLKRVAEELKKTGVKESRKENLIENPEGPRPLIPSSRLSNPPFLKTKQDEVNLVTSIEGGAYGAGGKTPNPEINIIERPALQKGEIHPAPYAQNDLAKQKTKDLGGGVKIAKTALSDLIQEKMKLEKILQELNNLKSKICQRIGLIKTIEKREKELEQQLASARKENDFSDQIKKRFENLKENIKPR